MRNPLHIRRLLEDTASAIEASLPHAQQATEAGREMLELIAELSEPNSHLSEEERATMRRRIAELSDQATRENAAAERPYEQLSARHPDWVDY